MISVDKSRKAGMQKLIPKSKIYNKFSIYRKVFQFFCTFRFDTVYILP